MTKISILRILLTFFAFFAVLFLIVMIKMPVHSYTITNNPAEENTQLIMTIGASLQFPVIICLIIAMHYFLQYGYFNTKSVKMLRASAYIMAGSAVLELVLYLVLNYIPGWEEWTSLPLTFFGRSSELLISLGILVVADFVKQGISIQKENNLTI